MVSPEVLERVQGPPEWEIYPSCDIALGEAFRNRPGLENSYIGVNIDSIQEAIKRLGGGAPGFHKMHLLVQRAEFDGIQNEDSIDIQVHGCFKAYDKDRKRVPPADTRTPIDLYECQVDVGINHIRFIQDGIMDEKRDLGLDDDQLIEHADKALQLIATHEVKHAVDYSQDEVRVENAKYRQTLVNKISVGVMALTYGGLFATNAVTSRIYDELIENTSNNSQIPMAAAIGITLAAVLTTIKKGAVPYFNRKFSTESPAEKAAYDNSIVELSTQLPNMVSIVA